MAKKKRYVIVERPHGSKIYFILVYNVFIDRLLNYRLLKLALKIVEDVFNKKLGSFDSSMNSLKLFHLKLVLQSFIQKFVCCWNIHFKLLLLLLLLFGA